MGEITVIQVYIYSFFAFLLIMIFILVLVRNQFKSRLLFQQKLNKVEHDKQQEINLAKAEWSKNVADDISRELHDNVNQMLAFVRMSLSGMEKKVNDPLMLEDLVKVKDEVSLTIETIRNISRILSKDNFDKFDFEKSLNNQKQLIEIGSEINVSIELFAHPNAYIPIDVQIMLFRIIQEFIQNSIKYSACKNIKVRFSEIENMFQVLLQDDGIGFDQEQTQKGLGLSNIIKRAEIIEAQFNLETKPNAGTKMELSLPIN